MLEVFLPAANKSFYHPWGDSSRKLTGGPELEKKSESLKNAWDLQKNTYFSEMGLARLAACSSCVKIQNQMGNTLEDLPKKKILCIWMTPKNTSNSKFYSLNIYKECAPTCWKKSWPDDSRPKCMIFEPVLTVAFLIFPFFLVTHSKGITWKSHGEKCFKINVIIKINFLAWNPFKQNKPISP